MVHEAHWPIPEPHDAATVDLADGGRILLRRHGNPDGPRLVLSHGSSFSADAYFPFWSLLLPRFDLIVYDLRNHGRNPLGDLAGHHMPMMVWDNLRVVRAIDRHFGEKPKIGRSSARLACQACCGDLEIVARQGQTRIGRGRNAAPANTRRDLPLRIRRCGRLPSRRGEQLRRARAVA